MLIVAGLRRVHHVAVKFRILSPIRGRGAGLRVSSTLIGPDGQLLPKGRSDFPFVLHIRHGDNKIWNIRRTNSNAIVPKLIFRLKSKR